MLREMLTDPFPLPRVLVVGTDAATVARATREDRAPRGLVPSRARLRGSP